MRFLREFGVLVVVFAGFGYLVFFFVYPHLYFWLEEVRMVSYIFCYDFGDCGAPISAADYADAVFLGVVV